MSEIIGWGRTQWRRPEFSGTAEFYRSHLSFDETSFFGENLGIKWSVLAVRRASSDESHALGLSDVGVHLRAPAH